MKGNYDNGPLNRGGLRGQEANHSYDVNTVLKISGCLGKAY